jgi:hypothetical protein
MSRAACMILCALAVVAVPALAAAPKVPSGKFRGVTSQKQNFTISVAGKRIQYATFAFTCGKEPDVTGVVSLQDFPVTKSKGAYRLSLFAYGSMNYSDDKGYENGQVHLKGRFSSTGRGATGTVRVQAARCGDTHSLKWHARR